MSHRHALRLVQLEVLANGRQKLRHMSHGGEVTRTFD